MFDTATQNQTRDLIQDKAVELSKDHNHLVLNFSTGVGKSLASIKIIQELIDRNPKAKGYIVCKENTHKKNWIDDIAKHGYNHLLSNLTFILYASARKMSRSNFIVLDECHSLTPKRARLIKPLISEKTKVLYLSATIKEEKKEFIQQLSRHTAHYYTVSLVEAISKGLLPTPRVVVHKIKMDIKVRRNVFVMKKGKGKNKITCDYYDRWKHYNLYSDLSLSVKCNDKEYYELLTGQMAYYKELAFNGGYKYRTACKNKFLNIGSQRKKFIASTKTNAAKLIIDGFRKNDTRFICFTGSIDQSSELGAESAIHSKNTVEHNQNLVDCFNDKECEELFAVKMLREGVNLTEVHKGIVVQLDSTMGSFYQMLGRCLRHEFPEIHLLIVEDTQDEVYFSNAMQDFDMKFVTNG